MCECIAEVNGMLKQHNAALEVPIIGYQRPFVKTMKLDDKKRGKIPYMFASFCPFCGEKYTDESPLAKRAALNEIEGAAP